MSPERFDRCWGWFWLPLWSIMLGIYWGSPEWMAVCSVGILLNLMRVLR
jgi:hypothetical protein